MYIVFFQTQLLLLYYCTVVDTTFLINILFIIGENHALLSFISKYHLS